jgi:hypothetical protein
MASQLLTTFLTLLVASALHYGFWRGMFVATKCSARVRRWSAVYLVISCLSVPLTIWLPRLGLSAIGRRVVWFSMLSMAVVGLTCLAMLFMKSPLWLGRAARWFAQRRTATAVAPDQAALTRRQLLTRATSGAAAVAGTLAVARGVANARGEHIIERIEVTLPGLPRALDGFRIVQLSDLHVGLTIAQDFVQRVVDRANALQPDLFVLTGDLVDGKVHELRDDIAPLAQLRARHGVYAITGNHEYYSGADVWVAHIETLGIRFLRNQRVSIGDDNASFDLAGIEDRSAHHYAGHRADLHAALAGRDPNRGIVLLAHQPRQAHQAAALGLPLVLSGHTHGGQIWPWHLLVWIQQGGLISGRYQLQATTLYVNRGCGYVGPPVRLGAPLEIAEITLRSPEIVREQP